MSIVLSALILAAPDAATLQAIESGQLDRAEELLLTQRERGVWDLDDQMTLAAVCLGKGDLECADYLYRESLKPAPRSALAFFGLAEIARIKGRMISAKKYYEEYLRSNLPGRSKAYDAIVVKRLADLAAAPAALTPRRPRAKPPSFQELSWAASRAAGYSFFPAILGGTLIAAVYGEQTNDGIGTVILGLGTGAALFGGGVAWGIDRVAKRRGYTGPFLKTAAAAVFVPLTIAGGGAFLLGTSDLPEDLIGPLATIGTISSVFLVPPYVYMQEMTPIE